MRDGKVRRDCLIALAMVIVAAVVLVWILFAVNGVLVDHLVTAAVSTATGLPTAASRTAAYSAFGATAAVGLVAARRRRRRHRSGPVT
jgi:hypothetical protein